MHDPNAGRPTSQPGPAVQSYDELLKMLADRHWAEMHGESDIIAGFFEMLSKIAAARREFLEIHGLSLQRLASAPMPSLPQHGPSPRANGHDDGAAALAHRMAPSRGGR